MTARAAAIAAAVLAGLFALALAWRPLASFDLGYHLAYGDEFWRHGRVVGDASFIVPPPTAAEAGSDLPPGARFESDGTYTFPNANWASQALLAAMHAGGGAAALAGLNVVLLAAILLVQARVVRTATGTWGWTGLLWLATAFTSYERLSLRPELLGNLCLVAQLAVLMAPLTLRRALVWLAIQIVAVNVHSYWILGLVLLAAAALDAALHARRTRRPPRADRRRLAAIAVAAACVCAGALHPASWRNLVLPAQTLAYMRAHDIGGATPEIVQARAQRGDTHPWRDTGELYRTLSAQTLTWRATRAFVVLLVVAIPAAWWLARRGRPGLALVLVAIVLVALPVRRNLASAGFVAWPLVAVAADWGLRRRAASRWAVVVLAATAVAAVAGIASVVSNRFYTSEQRDTRFGSGWARTALPIDTCVWLDAHLDRPQPVFANFNVSSSVLYFSERVTAVPILTNAWAYPPARKARLLAIQAGREWIDPFARDAGLDVAVFYALPSIRPLLSRLVVSPDWALVHLDGPFVVFARRTAAHAMLIRDNAITHATIDRERLAARARALDPASDRGLRATAGALAALGWDDHARALLGARPPASGR